jgi:glycosyltransferase involved in cell wall biosynthesis
MKALLHHHVWQRLPREWRRALLFRATALVAPRPTAEVEPTTPIIVCGALRTASGLGESARLCHEALKVAGLPVYGIDLTALMMQPEDSPDFAFADGRALVGPGVLIFHINSPVLPLAMLRLGSRLVRQKRIVGYWAWELPKLPSEWQRGMPFVHEIWVPSTFTADAVKPMAAGRSVRVVPHPVTLGVHGHAAIRQVVDRPFTVLTIFNAASSVARKNPLASIMAFRCAFADEESTRLIVKVSNLSAFPESFRLIKNAVNSADNIVLIDRVMNRQELSALYEESDVVVSLHRSEGFGLTIAEAMLCGIPVVATDWSGNVDFFKPGIGIPVPYHLIPAKDPQGTYHHPDMMWADADVGAAAEALRDLRNDPTLRKELGDAAAKFAANAWGAENYTGMIRQHLGL